MQLTDLNRDGGIGSNSFFLKLGGLNLLLDCGLHPKKVGRVATPDLKPLRGQRLDLIIITHCHLDHIGSLPVVMREHPDAPVVMTSSSRMLIERMLHNSANVMMRQKEDERIPDYPLFTHEEIDRCARRFVGLPFGQPRRFPGLQDEIILTFHLAGHVAGAAGVELLHRGRRIFSTGDVMFEPQRIQQGAAFPPGPFDVLITETTRGATQRPPGKGRAAEMQRLCDRINETLQRGGSFLIPVFALGRMQEILTIVHDARRFRKLADCPIFASGLGMDIVDYFDEITKKTKHINFHRSVTKELKIKPLPRKLKAGEDPGQNALYIVSSGMLVERTPSYVLASGLLGQARNGVGFVGYCDPDTPGGKLLAAQPGESFEFEAVQVRTKVRASVDRFELSGHADRDELLDYAVRSRARQIVLTHGDPPARDWFAGQLAARMPGTRVLDPVPLKTYEV
ncbi:MAG TPA: MBL fold metallo-hydrolase [Opitutaceae bacterium]|nr:MBL fold metallo-hydrolase [Opitutaceae bacterium]